MISMYHSMAKDFIYFNASKPHRKHNCKFYVVCENEYWAVINVRLCHRSYDNKGTVDEKGELTDEDNDYDVPSKTTTTEIKPLRRK